MLEAFNDSGVPSGSQVRDSTLAVAVSDSTDMTTLQTPTGGLISGVGSDVLGDWGTVRVPLLVDSAPVGFVIDCTGSWNNDGTTGIAAVDFYVAVAP